MKDMNFKDFLEYFPSKFRVFTKKKTFFRNFNAQSTELK